MGLILDSSVLIHDERRGLNAHQSLNSIAKGIDNDEVAISVVTVLELAHGAARAESPERRIKREQFIHELLTALPVHPISTSIAIRAGQLDGLNQAKGIRIALADLLIGVTALELGFAVATSNLRHFEKIPGLSIRQF